MTSLEDQLSEKEVFEELNRNDWLIDPFYFINENLRNILYKMECVKFINEIIHYILYEKKIFFLSVIGLNYHGNIIS